MKFRPWFLGAFLVAALGVNLYLMSGEQIPRAQDKGEAGPTVVEPLLNVVYRAEDREKNLRLFGLKDEDAARGVKTLKSMDHDAMRQKLRTLLTQANNESPVARLVCKGQEGLPRYNLLAYLVKEEQGLRDPISLESLTTLSLQPWAANSPITEVCKLAETSKGRRPDAMTMAVASILLQREEDLIKRKTPWGSGIGTVWSWDRVAERYPRIGERVTRYLVAMHLVLEVSHEDGGFCGD